LTPIFSRAVYFVDIMWKRRSVRNRKQLKLPFCGIYLQVNDNCCIHNRKPLIRPTV